MRQRIMIGSYEVSWNKTTWKNWLPFTTVMVLLSLAFIGLGVYHIV